MGGGVLASGSGPTSAAVAASSNPPETLTALARARSAPVTALAMSPATGGASPAGATQACAALWLSARVGTAVTLGELGAVEGAAHLLMHHDESRHLLGRRGEQVAEARVHGRRHPLLL